MSDDLNGNNLVLNQKRKSEYAEEGFCCDNDLGGNTDCPSSDFDTSSCCSRDDQSSQALDEYLRFSRLNSHKWSAEEDNKLQIAIEILGESRWRKISSFVGSRNHVQCLQRWQKNLKPGLIKGQWTDDEDASLTKLVRKGFKNWGKLAAHMPGRTSKQCRERWCHHLDSSVNKNDFTAEEDYSLLHWQYQFGNRWATIARMMPGRTENSVKIRFKSLEKAMRLGQLRVPSEIVPESYDFGSESAKLTTMVTSTLQVSNIDPDPFVRYFPKELEQIKFNSQNDTHYLCLKNDLFSQVVIANNLSLFYVANSNGDAPI